MRFRNWWVGNGHILGLTVGSIKTDEQSCSGEIDMKALRDQVEQRFSDLTSSELRLIEAASSGQPTKFGPVDSSGSDHTVELEKADQWGTDRTIRAGLIRLLLFDAELANLVHHNGIDVEGARIEGKLDFAFLTLRRRLRLCKCFIPDGVDLYDCDAIRLNFGGSRTASIDAHGLVVRGSIVLNDGFSASSLVDFSLARIGGDLVCSGGRFINPGKKALSVVGAEVGGTVYFGEGFHAEGEVDLSSAQIKGNVICTGSDFCNPGKKAISAALAVIRGSAHLGDGFTADGRVWFFGAQIGTDLLVQEAQFKGADGWNGLVMPFATAEVFSWAQVQRTNFTGLDLRSATVGLLADTLEDWPSPGKLFLDGFVYKRFGDDSPRDAQSRLRWLSLQWNDEIPFTPQPYRQLAAVFRESGQEGDAIKVLIAKEDALRTHGGLGRTERIGKAIMKATIGYGYKPLRALWWIAAFIALGTALFGLGYQNGAVTPSERDASESYSNKKRMTPLYYPQFNALIFSVDTFLPVVDLHQAKFWLPNSQTGPTLHGFGLSHGPSLGALLRWYLWLHIMAGWFFASMFVAGVTGLVRKD